MSDGPHIIGPTYRELEAERDALKARCERLEKVLVAARRRMVGWHALDDVIEAIDKQLDAIDKENT